MDQNKPKVLLIDDDQTLVDMYKLKFSLDANYSLLTAGDTVRAIQLAESEQPQLILLDLILPKQEGLPGTLNKEVGFHLLGLFKGSPKTKSIPVVVFTNLDERTQDNVERAKKLGALGYWVKAHYKPAEVVEKVKKIVK
jgi:CheY-like chemotaxis protein